MLFMITKLPGTDVISVFFCLVELDIKLFNSVSIICRTLSHVSYPFVQPLDIGTLYICGRKTEPRMKDYQSCFGMKVLVKLESVRLDYIDRDLALPGSPGSTESAQQPGLRKTSWSHRWHQHDPEVGERNYRPAVYLDLDLSDYWFFLDLFSPNWLGMPSPVAHEDVDALWSFSQGWSRR